MEQADWEIKNPIREFGAPQKQYQHESQQKTSGPTALKRIYFHWSRALFKAKTTKGECGMQAQLALQSVAQAGSVQKHELKHFH